MEEGMIVRGGCHCGAVRFEALIREPRPELLDCNCSMCSKTGFLHLIVPHEDFTLMSGEEALSSYRFGTGQADHLFCRHCGIKSYYQPRSHPEAWSVNYNALDEGHGLDVTIRKYDGQNWEAAKANL
ncbi:GFA family protein [Parasphingopyxis sp. CP4]|uniref:GFA family protein n=1 Tax=Parasphingopyxis sp. CP4 TaxID=2724527 RepID=UPI002104A20C|nr:GFA family protein [Parasphingopyxis sp. CP4]